MIGELARGNLSHRLEVIEILANLPSVPTAEHDELSLFVSGQRLNGRGLGWVDIHVLAAACLAHRPIWTLDRRLAAVASELAIDISAS